MFRISVQVLIQQIRNIPDMNIQSGHQHIFQITGIDIRENIS